ncbi:type II toxin-antitoxin system VapC family toxin [Synoicihabitans lomoniglobus]|uniref:Ribonuclease VapC n=1 Tax=Synoicihabitans lomoniglobus TaxID=2909285 RepID=A0AAE9ZVA3_9BACT|nr:type II toxin-antitoxin system VapC family toxin [Opitutaceae bacterium LMO-M01]WED64752.1 type II toxin-antitoxin system VapC family toxin [Opitutaceae bacterium LMO-M01]
MNSSRILVDNNALSDLFVGDEGLQADAERLRRKFRDWMAPPLCRYEFGNVLRTYVRAGRRTEEVAQSMLGKGLGMVRFCEEPSDEVILGVAMASNLTFYDATYVACARALSLTLYTRDGDILRNCPDVARRISEA